ncbi:MAG: hypothetical protein P4L34_00445 [Paludibacter sp.]|nr:hypothetical protein [Paludibacter sp.]
MIPIFDNIKLLLFSISLLFISFSFSACNDNIYSTNPKDRLSFSSDTLTFDTVFTTIGSATSKIMIYNRNNVALKISHIGIAGGKESSFKINVDGSLNTNNQFDNVEIGAKDSLYVFVAVNVNPTSSNSPVFIRDSIVFQTNGINQSVKLQAFGQDVKIFRNKYILNDTTLTSEKPYIVYGYLAIDTAKTLTINPGCKFYFHNNANLIVYGNLKAEGTAEAPISMRGDRLDNVKFSTPFPYNNVSGQWGGLYLLWEGGNHTLQHVNLNSGYVGVYFSNSNRNSIPNLEINDCRIQNFLLYGLIVENGNVQVTNTEISNSSSYSVLLSGGKHTFIQSTIANYFDNSSIQPVSRDGKPAVMIMNLNRVSPMESVFRNCIISGSADNEFSLASLYLKQYNGIFDHCYIRKPDSLNLPQFTNIRWSQKNDNIFKSVSYNLDKNTYFDFSLDSLSPARGLANPTTAAQFPIDLNGNNRLVGNKPDAGAYQWEPTK